MGTKVTVNHIPNCDICSQDNVTRRAEYDAKTVFGAWANMCEEHFASFGIGLGTGLGQRLVQG